MADLSKLSNEELLKLQPSAAPAALDLSHLSNEDLLKLKPGDSHVISDVALGALKGAANIGTTLMRPLDATGLTGRTNEDRKASVKGFFDQRADTDSLPFKGGELASEIAGTAGVGGVLAKGVTAASKVIPAVAQYAPKLAAALESGGFKLGTPAATTVGGKAADMATRVGAGAAVGGASAGLVDPDNAAAGATIGGALPAAARAAGAVGSAVRKAVTPEVAPEVATLYQKAKDLGIEIPADRIVNSKPLNAVAASLNYLPLTGRAGTEELMNSQLNRALSKTFGQNSDNVTQALRKAQTDLGNKFEITLKSNTVKADDELVNDLVSHLQTAHDELGTEGANIIGKQIDAIMSKVGTNGEIDGQAAYNIKKALDRIGNRNTPEAYYARELKKSLMGALDRSLGPEKSAEFAKVRRQYGNMLDLEPLAPNGAEGEISAARLANLRKINDPQMQDIADIASQFVKGRENPHGAAQRVAVATSIYGLPAAAVGATAGRAANAALNFGGLKNLVLGNNVRNLANSKGNALPALRALVYDQPSRANP